MNKFYKYGFWILVIYVFVDISLYATSYDCMNRCIRGALNLSKQLFSLCWAGICLPGEFYTAV